MSHKPFKVGTNNALVAQPNLEAGIFVRTPSNPDDTITVHLYGADGEGSAVFDAFVGPFGLEEAVASEVYQTLAGVVIEDSNFLNASLYVFSFGEPATGEFRVETNPADATTLTIGLVGRTKIYRFKNTLAAVNDVKIGADATATMLSLKKAINLDGIAGTDYFTGTIAHPDMSAVVSGTIITLTDRIPCNRQLNWSFTQSSTHFSLPSTLSGGLDGPLLAIIPLGTDRAYNPFVLSSEDLVTLTLPALLAPITDTIKLSGRSCTLQFKCANVVNAITLKYQTSTDGINWSDGLTSITSLDNNTVLVPRVVVPTERNIERIRLVFNSNTNTTNSAVDARVIF